MEEATRKIDLIEMFQLERSATCSVGNIGGREIY
jgi:hypothetical protein